MLRNHTHWIFFCRIFDNIRRVRLFISKGMNSYLVGTISNSFIGMNEFLPLRKDIY